ncbi:hypothetical protein K438DRAFT_1962134 [Mycena galopus ATCC 62051]|nr:hypothetical protein K438DRAFT_1962134 [Mycena galopus ATCC 62051]
MAEAVEPFEPLHPTWVVFKARAVETSSTSSIAPAPTSSSSSSSTADSTRFPAWASPLVVLAFGSLLVLSLYMSVKESRRFRSSWKLKSSESGAQNGPITVSAWGSNETLVNGRGSVINPPPSAYTAATDTAAPGMEDALFYPTRVNTLRNQRRQTVQVEPSHADITTSYYHP